MTDFLIGIILVGGVLLLIWVAFLVGNYFANKGGGEQG